MGRDTWSFDEGQSGYILTATSTAEYEKLTKFKNAASLHILHFDYFIVNVWKFNEEFCTLQYICTFLYMQLKSSGNHFTS